MHHFPKRISLDLPCTWIWDVIPSRLLRKMLSIGVSPPVDKIIRSGAVPYLVQLLDTTEIEKYYHIVKEQLYNANVHLKSNASIDEYQIFQLQVEATWAITNIAGGTTEHVRYIVELGCVPLLIQLLSSKNDALKEQAVWAIGNIAGDSGMFRDYLLEMGALDRIVELMQKRYCYTLSLRTNGKSY